ncbi:hypothetical protein CBGD1_546 [Sulfurimonas gotlandica GD1]|nr:hypothetical protein CBGD1_546 [Sulfurimonas gotlandica GD1]
MFNKVEKFFALEESEQEKKENKRDKLSNSLEKKITSLKKKIKKAKDADEKEDFKKQLGVLNEFLEKLE